MIGSTSKKERMLAYETRLATHPATDSAVLVDHMNAENQDEYRVGGTALREDVSSAYVTEMVAAGFLTADKVYTLTKAVTHADVGRNTLLVGTLPNGCILTNVTFTVGTAFTSGVHVEIGTLVDPNAYVTTADMDITTTGAKSVDLTTSITEETAVYMTFNPAEDLVAGAGTVVLTYSVETSGVNISHADAGGAAVSLGTVPSGSDLITFKITVSEAFDGSSTLTVGTAADPDLFVAAGIDLSSATSQTATVTAAAFGTATEVVVTVTGTAPTTGHAACTLVYTTPVTKAMTYADCDGTVTLVGQIPAVRTLTGVTVTVSEAFSATTLLKLGTAANPDAFVDTTDVDLTSETEQDVTVTSTITPATNVYVTLAGPSGSEGEATIVVSYK